MGDHARDSHDDQADQEHTTDGERADRNNQKRRPQEQSLLEDKANQALDNRPPAEKVVNR